MKRHLQMSSSVMLGTHPSSAEYRLEIEQDFLVGFSTPVLGFINPV